MKMLSRKFVFGIVAMICISAVTWKLQYDGDTFLKLVGAIIGAYMAAQTITDTKK